MGLKLCKRCKLQKELSEYYKFGNYYIAVCKICYVARRNKARIRVYDLQRKYKLTDSEYDNLVKQCKGLCLICKKTSKLNVDHNHKTGKVRGLLCTPCNRGLGMFQDSPELLITAAQYLQS